MGNAINLAEECHVSMGLYPINGTGLTTMDAINMEGYSHLSILIAAGASNGAAHTVTVLASTNNAAGSAEAIPFTYYRAVTTGSDVFAAAQAAATTGFAMSNNAVNSTMYTIEIDASELPDTKPWVNVTLSGAASTAPLSVTYVQSGARYAAPESPTVLS
jgi:hypothetical protein